jgi:hypothetical protein
MKILFTDLDGTLLSDQGSLSDLNRETLLRLQELKIIRVVATGRNLYSARKILTDDFPIDYLIFSTGAGIMDWKKKEIIYRNNIPNNSVRLCSEILTKGEINFMLHQEIPDSHYFYYYPGNFTPPDFQHRIKIYSDYAQPFEHKRHSEIPATQFLCMLTPESFPDSYDKIASASNEFSIIKTTSPLLEGSLWLEIYAAGVSKGNAAQHLTDILGITKKSSMAIGNDFNDLDLLEWSSNSFVVANAPSALKAKYPLVADNFNNGFTDAVRLWLDLS